MGGHDFSLQRAKGGLQNNRQRLAVRSQNEFAGNFGGSQKKITTVLKVTVIGVGDPFGEGLSRLRAALSVGQFVEFTPLAPQTCMQPRCRYAGEYGHWTPSSTDLQRIHCAVTSHVIDYLQKLGPESRPIHQTAHVCTCIVNIIKR